MYEYLGLNDFIYTMLYGAAAMFAVVAAAYLLIQSFINVPTPIHPPKRLRLWAAAFMISAALSHVWWLLLGLVCLVDDRIMRNAVAMGLDCLTLMPTMMTTLLCLLQDKRRPLWPIALAMLPIAAICFGMGAIAHNPFYERALQIYQLILVTSFIAYMLWSVRQYGRWLRDNYADLEHKQIWSSLILLTAILIIFGAYKINFGGMTMEYATQINTIFIVAFLLWRVETLQELEQPTPELDTPAEHVLQPIEQTDDDSDLLANSEPSIEIQLKRRCEDTLLFLRHDLTLDQVSKAIRTNRTYLSQHFSQNGITYNAYINQLRINHFINLYHDAITTGQPFTAKQLAYQSCFHNYNTFSNAFKLLMGQTVTDWIKSLQ